MAQSCTLPTKVEQVVFNFNKPTNQQTNQNPKVEKSKAWSNRKEFLKAKGCYNYLDKKYGLFKYSWLFGPILCSID